MKQRQQTKRQYQRNAIKKMSITQRINAVIELMKIRSRIKID